MDAPIAELARRLLETADRGLLDQPLDALGERADSEEARVLFRALHEAGEADTVRDLLGGDRLAQWVEETCTQSEEHALGEQLRSWLGLSGGASRAGGDDPARLVSLGELPEDPEALVRWAREHRVVGELMRPVAEVLHDEADADNELTLLEACFAGSSRETPRSRQERLAQNALRQRARAYLLGEAASALATGARDALWARPWPSDAIRPLGERLRGTVASHTPNRLAGIRFVPARPVTIDQATGRCCGLLHTGTESVAVTLLLSGFEQRALDGTCEACRRPRCVHQAALAARLLDACLDPTDRLHTSLVEFARVPSWRRFVDALAGEAPSDAEAAPKLHYVVRVQDGQAEVGVMQERRHGPERGSPGRIASPQRLLRSGQLAPQDRALLEAMASRGRTLTARFVSADLAVLRGLVEHPHVRLEGSDAALRVSEQTALVELIPQPDGVVPRVTLAGAELTARPRDSYALRLDAQAGVLVFATLTPELRRVLAALEHFRGVLPEASYPSLAPWLASLQKVAQVSAPPALQGHERPSPNRLLLRIEPRFDEGLDVALRMRVFPLSPLWPPGLGPELVHGLENGVRVFGRRNLDWERTTAERAREALGLHEHPEIERFAHAIPSELAALELLSRAARLSDILELEWAERARPLRIARNVRASDLKIRLFKRGHWLALSGGAAGSGKEPEIAMDSLLDAVRRGERFVRVQGRDYAEIEQDLFERLEATQLGVTRIDHALALALAAAPSFLEQLGPQTLVDDSASVDWLSRLPQPATQAPALPAALAAQLRDYQRDGAQFLLRLAEWSPGACLADEMGLGKTVQTIAVLLSRAAAGPGLIVAPTSLISNWLAELARFAPELRAIAYRGPERRQHLEELAPGTLLITSYELLLRDLALFEGRRFATQVIDEAQVIKNARTQRARAVAAIQADFRIALSGTPIENRLGDLWSLFQIIAPGLLGSWPRFRSLFAVPIERYEDTSRAARLRNLVAPFILRRTKDDVAPELPARTEVVHVVELSPPEQDLYRSALRHARRALGKRRRHPDDQTPTIAILAELTRLRQLACHPRLVVQDARIESSKLLSLLRILDDILPRGHRVLLFSQFTAHLALIREALVSRGIHFLYLDGAVPGAERGRLVERFQGGEAEVFLISLKAGGTGLNLTAADYVIHMDPWWNPSAESQASDRAHRIGQERPVTVVKLVAQGTIEERVLGLHEHKRRIASTVLDEGGASGVLDEEALEALLAE